MNLKNLIKKIIVALVAFIGLFTMLTPLAIDLNSFYTETGFTFFAFNSNIIEGSWEWAIYVIGACCILVFLLQLALAVVSGVNFIFKKDKISNLVSYITMGASLLLTIFYALIGLIIFIVTVIIGWPALTIGFIPFVLQAVCVAGYFIVGKFVPDTLGQKK